VDVSGETSQESGNMSYDYASPYHRGSATPNTDYWASASPTPSPHHGYWAPPQRPATRATHTRHVSSGGYADDYRATFSPRFTSTGEYATGVPGPRPKVSARKPSFSGSRQVPKRERRSSYSYYWTPHGDSDEDEYIEVDGVTYVLPAQSRSRRYNDYYAAGRHGTDHSYYKQGPPQYERYEKTAYFEDPVPRSATRLGGHGRRASASMPIPRPQTTRPSSAHKHAAPPVAKATEADARKHQIPRGYSLKNWDPTEEPILLLGSVFDPNSLGKWIYDWTVYRHGANTPIPDMAGELWLLLIQLSGKMKRSEEIIPQIRTPENREMLEDFIESGERLTDKLRALLEKCEAPMLNASKKTGAPQLDNRSGVEFVKTIWGRERELERTERFMQQLRLWNHRFDTNCEELLKKPTK
jgi:hypothetical protein